MEKYLDLIEQECLRRERRPVTSHWASKLSRMAKCQACYGTGEYSGADWQGEEPEHRPCEACSGEGHVLQGECMRALFWHMIGLAPSDETEAGAALKMSIGSAIHDLTESTLGRGAVIVPECYLSYHPECLHLPIVARVDAIALVPGEPVVDLVEVKTIADSQMRYLQKERQLRDDWFTQGCVGAALWMREYPHLPVRNMHFPVIARGNANRYEAVRAATPETVEEVLAECVLRCKELEGWVYEAARGEDVLPPPEYRHLGSKGEWSHWKCDRYCPWRTRCKEVENETT